MNRTSTQPANRSASVETSTRLARLLAVAAALFLSVGCTSEKDEPVTSSQTHWLQQCDSSDDCGDELSCECGVCTLSCDGDALCDGLHEDAVCADTADVAGCGSNAPSQVCLEGCEDDDDCATGNTCNGQACVPDGDSGETPPGVDCGDYDTCDAESPCEGGVNCIAFTECGGALCIPGDEACELSCPDPDECALAESYPEQLFCEGQVPANPADDGTDTDGTDTDGTDTDGTDTGTDVTDPDATDADGTDTDTPGGSGPDGVMCGNYESCDALSPCESGVNCIAFPECNTALCIPSAEACELSCPDPSDCAIAESYPEQLFCEGRVPATPGEPSIPVDGDGIQCADHPLCDPAGDGCAAGLECLIVPECGTDPTNEHDGAICIDSELACELSCPDSECALEESYPARLGCSGERVPATPADQTPSSTDGGVTSDEFVCGDHQQCGADVAEACPSDTICVSLPECGDDLAYGVCVAADVACDVRCPEGSTCRQLESYPVQISCSEEPVPCPPIACEEDEVMNEQTCECEAAPAGIACGDYEDCSLENSDCPAGADCIAIDGCDSAICIPADEACELSCPDPDECALMESFPLQIGCQGIVPGTEESSNVDLDLLNSECVDDACPDGLTPVHYFGIAGPQGPEFCSCSIPCAGNPGACPSGSSCQTIADGPGEVCVQE